MTFTSLELSKKLVALGCKSCSKFAYSGTHLEWWPEEYVFEGEERIPAFTLEDFVGTHEQAWENSKKVFGDGVMIGNEYANRYAMIDSDDWRDYLEKAVEGR